MKRFLLLWSVAALASVLFIGATEPPPRQRAVVIQMDIYSQKGTKITQQHITDMAQMSQVLNFLRALKEKGDAPSAPAPGRDNSHTVRIQLSDGRYHIYRLRSGCYLCKDSQGWKITKYSGFPNISC